jgi:HD superfamily phosphodiesterase
MCLAEIILSAEIRYKQILEQYFIKIWGKTILISHGIDHHRRVWHYAKELLAYVTLNGLKISQATPEKLLIACYLHDLGMSTDPGIRHGALGSELCRQFLEESQDSISDYDEILDAIENHDNKEYIESWGEDSILSLLSVADDLDAFGYIGIYRYSEIYLTRGLHLQRAGQMIRENATGRFLNFISLYGSNPELVKKHRQRYLVLDKFFSNFNRESDSYVFNGNDPRGHCGVLEIISGMVTGKIPLETIISKRVKFSGDSVITSFLQGLDEELKEFGDPGYYI